MCIVMGRLAEMMLQGAAGAAAAVTRAAAVLLCMLLVLSSVAVTVCRVCLASNCPVPSVLVLQPTAAPSPLATRPMCR